jgi:hypothetical protein
MSVIHTNNITNKDGTSGPTISGITTVSSTGFMRVPVGDTRTRLVNDYENIVTNGLVLHLDAGRAASYGGDGTTWRDLSGQNNNGTLQNGVGFTVDDGGSLIFDGVNDYVSSFPTQISTTGSRTVSCFFRTTTTVRNGLCGIRNDSQDAVGWLLTVNRTTPGNLTYAHTGGSIIELAAGIVTNTWYNASVTYDVTSATATLYLNGVQIGSPSTSFTAMTSSSFNGVIGNEESDFNAPFKGNIAQVSIYNRALTASEVLQNYNATKGRYS